MPEIDPVILQLRADVDRYQAQLRVATRTVDQQLGTQERRVKQLENQFRSSSGAIGSTLKGLAGTLAAAFTGRELIGLIDQFTRFQNSLKVAGLEGERLASVQERLRVIGRTYGADLEGLASTFSRIAQVQGDLGASTEDIIRLNEIVAASLKVAGTDAQAASGALLQLGQAFGSGVVRAEEFNSILEGALPLAQAAARGIDGFGGSVAKLRAAIADGQVTSKQFFEGVLKGGIKTIEDAEAATLTLSGAFTALRNELTTYVGEASAANGITSGLAGGIEALAKNLDTLIPIIATIAAGLGVGYLTNVVRAQVATATLGATATATGRAMLLAFGGPVGIAITALSVGLVALALNSESASHRIDRLKASASSTAREADEMEERLRAAGVSMGGVADASGQAENGIDGVGRAARSAKVDLAALEQQAIRTATALIDAQLQANSGRRVELGREARRAETVSRSPELAGRDTGLAQRRRAASTGFNAEIEQLDEEFRQLTRKRNAIIAGVANGVDFSAPASGAASPAPATVSRAAAAGGASGASSGPSGPDPRDIEARYLDELDSIRAQIASAQSAMARTAEERAELELRQLENAERQALRSLENDIDYDEAQKARVRGALETRAAAEREAIAFNLRAEQERRALDLAEERGRASIDALRLQYDLADTERDRRALALRILDAENDLLRSRLEGIVASETVNAVDQERARIALQALNAQDGAQRAVVGRQFATPLERFGINARDSDTRVEEAAVRRIEELNQTITDAMTDALGIDDPFLKDLVSIFLDKNFLGPLAEALAGAGGGGGGGAIGGLGSIVGSALGSLFGRSSGGFVQAGRPYRVNEGASPGRVEAFVPNTSGQIIPLGRMNAAREGGGSGGGVAVVRLDLSGDIDARIESISGNVAVEVIKVASPQIVNAAAGETAARLSRRTL